MAHAKPSFSGSTEGPVQFDQPSNRLARYSQQTRFDKRSGISSGISRTGDGGKIIPSRLIALSAAAGDCVTRRAVAKRRRREAP
jgi:hypothetical protein